jgi:hypothetical protein
MSEMADIWQYQFAFTGNQRGHVIGVLTLDDFVAVAVDDPSWHLDSTQLVI